MIWGNVNVQDLNSRLTRIREDKKLKLLFNALYFELLVVLLLSITGCINKGIEVTIPTHISTKPESIISESTSIIESPLPTQEKKPSSTVLTTSQTANYKPSRTATVLSELMTCSPLAEHRIDELSEIVSSPYDPPPMGKDDRHQGVDFAYYNRGERPTIEGEGVQAIMAGRVAAVLNNQNPYGNMVMIETTWDFVPVETREDLLIDKGESVYHLYGHLKYTPVLSAAWVGCGAHLGFVGDTGYNIAMAHLHLETRIGPSGTDFDDMRFYDTRASEAERENYALWRMSGLYRHFDPLLLFEIPATKLGEGD